MGVSFYSMPAGRAFGEESGLNGLTCALPRPQSSGEPRRTQPAAGEPIPPCHRLHNLHARPLLPR